MNFFYAVHKFYGQMDALQEFAWRNIDPTCDRNEFQLVGWGRDSVLTMWPIGGHLQVMCGEEKEDEDREGAVAEAAALEPQPPDQQGIVDQIEAGMQNAAPEERRMHSFRFIGYFLQLNPDVLFQRMISSPLTTLY